MKTLIITCSNRANNISYLMGMRLLRKIKYLEKEAEIEILQLADVNLKGCCGNAACAKQGSESCLYGDKDDFNKIYDKMVDSNCVIFLIPKYAPYPSKLVQLYERIVTIAWAGHIAKGNGEQFTLYQKSIALIGFAGTPDTGAEIFHSLRISFKENGFRMLSFGDELPGMFINRATDNEDEKLDMVAKAVAKVLEE